MGSLLVAIPAFNEEKTIRGVIREIFHHLPTADVVVVNDGSKDSTKRVVQELGVLQIQHCTNIGYGRAVQTALKFARRHGYEALATIDGDGQHEPADLADLVDRFLDSRVDLLIGSRYKALGNYNYASPDRRAGMLFFSLLTRALTGRRIFDTTSGLRVIRETTFDALARWRFVDFHSEAIVYLLRLGYSIEEHAITTRMRVHGGSMYGGLNGLAYPIKTLTMAVLGIIEAEYYRIHVKKGIET
ncbi:MAG: glycosyltransferase family 2 protein [bacterium]